MDLPVLTRVLRVQRKLWHLQKLPLPRPLTIPEFVVVVLILLGFLYLLGSGAPVEPWEGVFAVAAAMGAIWLLRRPATDAKTPSQWVASITRYLSQPKQVVRSRPAWEPTRVGIKVSVRVPINQRSIPEMAAPLTWGQVESELVAMSDASLALDASGGRDGHSNGHSNYPAQAERGAGP